MQSSPRSVPRRLTLVGVLSALLLALVGVQGGTAAPAAADPGVAPGERPARTITYTVRTRGTVRGDLAEFRRLASVTLNDRRGWSLGGSIRWREVSSGGDFVLWLASPSAVDAFAPICDASYSCRVGSNVVINDLRWRTGTAVWPDVAEYHHYVVNHEVGHWLGMGHRGCPGAGAPAPVMQQQSIALGRCVTNTWPTAAEKADGARRYRVPLRSSRPDLYAIKQHGDGGTAVHVIDGASAYARFQAHLPTALGRTSASLWDFAVADRDRDGVDDVVAIKRASSSGRIEVHVLDGASGYREWQLHTSTVLRQGAAGVWAYDAADVDGDGHLDVVAVNRQGAHGRTTVHVLDGATRFGSYLLHAVTPLPHLTAASWTLAMGDHDRDGVPDVYAIKRRGTASGRTEVQVLDGAGGYRTRSAHAVTPLPRTDASWDFGVDDVDGDGWDEVYGVRRDGATSTEVHVLADRGYGRFTMHARTPLPVTDGVAGWRFPVD